MAIRSNRQMVNYEKVVKAALKGDEAHLRSYMNLLSMICITLR